MEKKKILFICTGNSARSQGIKIDIAMTVCDNAKKVCPVFPGAKNNIHNSFTDPAEAKGTEEEILTIFRNVRDQIHKWIKENLIE